MHSVSKNEFFDTLGRSVIARRVRLVPSAAGAGTQPDEGRPDEGIRPYGQANARP